MPLNALDPLRYDKRHCDNAPRGNLLLEGSSSLVQSVQAEIDSQRKLAANQSTEVKRLTQLTADLKAQAAESASKEAEKSQEAIRQFSSQKEALESQIQAQQQVLQQRGSETKSNLTRVQRETPEMNKPKQENTAQKLGADVPEDGALRQQTQELEKENSLLRKQLSQLEAGLQEARCAF